MEESCLIIYITLPRILCRLECHMNTYRRFSRTSEHFSVYEIKSRDSEILGYAETAQKNPSRWCKHSDWISIHGSFSKASDGALLCVLWTHRNIMENIKLTSEITTRNKLLMKTKCGKIISPRAFQSWTCSTSEFLLDPKRKIYHRLLLIMLPRPENKAGKYAWNEAH